MDKTFEDFRESIKDRLKRFIKHWVDHYTLENEKRGIGHGTHPMMDSVNSIINNDITYRDFNCCVFDSTYGEINPQCSAGYNGDGRYCCHKKTFNGIVMCMPF